MRRQWAESTGGGVAGMRAVACLKRYGYGPREGKNSWQTFFEELLDAADRRS